MRKLIVTEFITLDGVIEAPGGDETNHPNGGWQAKYKSQQAGKYKIDELANSDTLLLGRNTYEAFAGFWPGQTDKDFAIPINRMPKYVVSSTLRKAEWNNSHIIRDVAKEVKQLKSLDAADILVYGSATLVKSLLYYDLIDELRLMVYPVVLGGGIKLFDDNLLLKKFKLKEARVMEEGVLILEYLPLNDQIKSQSHL